MKRIILTLATGLVAISMSGQQYKSAPSEIWPKNVPEAKAAKSTPKLDTQQPEHWVEVTNPTLETFKPAADKNNGQAVVVCPGGGYEILAYVKEGQEIAEWLAGQGYTAFVLAYRIPRQREGTLLDIFRAIRLVRAQGFKKVGCIGFSAGASLCCRASTRWTENTYPEQDEADKLSQRPDFAMLIYPAYLDEGPNHTISPELTVTKETSPLFVFTTQDDTSYGAPSSAAILPAMQKAGAPIELHFQGKGGHGYGMRGDGVGKVWPKLAEIWLKTQL